ncbi:MAG: transcription/translation regulatory transformer protein RfaH [Magnetococcales bacterium]|nr:transcription/translation regulatory transformer protein RfaH [Magnetococcales bacterium]
MYSKPNCEQIAKNNLSNQGYKCFLPKVKVSRTRQNKRIQVLEPFFCCYLFISLDLKNDNIAPIRSTYGVRGLLRFGDYYPPVEDEFVEILLDMANSEGVISVPLPKFAPGQSVKITGGPLSGYDAIFLCKNNKERALLLVDMIGIKKYIHLSLDDLVPTYPSQDGSVE